MRDEHRQPSHWLHLFHPRRALAGLWRARPGPDGALDGVRALSVLAVVWVHAVHQYLGYGALASPPALASHPLLMLAVPASGGVDAFFVLSGFLITRQLLEEHRATGRLSLAAFYRRRAFRILPLYFAVLLLTLPSWPRPERALFNVFMVNNLLPIPEQVLPWSWSLAVEEQFYLVFPWLLLPLLALGPRGRATALGLLAALLAGWAFWLASHAGLTLPYAGAVDPRAPFADGDPYIASLYLRTDFRGAALLVGACLAAVEVVAAGRFHAARVGAGVVGLGVLGAMHTVPALMGFVPSTDPLLVGAWYAGRHVVYALAVAAVMFSLRGTGWLARGLTAVLGHRVFAGLARLTFALYLLHPVALWLGYLLHPGTFSWGAFLGLTALGLGIAVALSVALYALVEQPFLALRDWRRPAGSGTCATRAGVNAATATA